MLLARLWCSILANPTSLSLGKTHKKNPQKNPTEKAGQKSKNAVCCGKLRGSMRGNLFIRFQFSNDSSQYYLISFHLQKDNG